MLLRMNMLLGWSDEVMRQTTRRGADSSHHQDCGGVAAWTVIWSCTDLFVLMNRIWGLFLSGDQGHINTQRFCLLFPVYPPYTNINTQTSPKLIQFCCKEDLLTAVILSEKAAVNIDDVVSTGRTCAPYGCDSQAYRCYLDKAPMQLLSYCTCKMFPQCRNQLDIGFRHFWISKKTYFFVKTNNNNNNSLQYSTTILFV